MTKMVFNLNSPEGNIFYILASISQYIGSGKAAEILKYIEYENMSYDKAIEYIKHTCDERGIPVEFISSESYEME